MAKLIVETTGAFMLMDGRGNFVPTDRPAVLPVSPFVDERRGRAQLRILSDQLPDEANDAEWAEWWAEAKGDRDLAIESYVAKFAADEVDGEPPPRTKRTKKAAD